MADDGPTIESREGPTPAGGVRSEVIYSGDDGDPCPKSRATHGEVAEFDESGSAIARTYFDIPNRSDREAVGRYLGVKPEGDRS